LGKAEDMSCDCHFEAGSASQRRVLRVLLGINGTMFVVEAVVGLFADSSGVLADSLDMLADALVYGTSMLAIGRSDTTKVRAARWSGWFQIILATGIAVDVLRRATLGSEPSSHLMMAVSLLALAANAYCLLLLTKHRDGEVHMRASWIFTRSDVIANVGVIAASLLVALSDTRWPDLLIGAAITLVVLRGGIEILSEARKAAQPGAPL
jgi:Co/Zn/Cd efflux system component